jgi:acetyl-CoA synthetase
MTDHTEIAKKLVAEARKEAGESVSAAQLWTILQHKLKPTVPFEVHHLCYETAYEGIADVKPAWIPSQEVAETTNIHKMMTKKGFGTYQEFYEWSVGKETRDDFWMESMENIKIAWETEPNSAFDMSKGGPAHASYFPEGRLNVTDSCFNKREPQEAALVYSMESDARSLQTMSFHTLDRLSNQIANAISTKLNLEPGDSIGICMPMTPESIAIYLGVVKSGCVVISIADSFSAEEIATRCRLGKAKVIFTQDVIFRGAKFLPLFGRVLEADQLLQEETESQETDFDDSKETKSDSDVSQSMKIVVLPGLLHAGSYPKRKNENGSTWGDQDEQGNPMSIHESVTAMMRVDHDARWYDLLNLCSDEFVSAKRDSMDPCNILFSSGTTGEPKAIIWSHSTPIKCAIDGHYHQDIHTGDRVAWPTNLGWMMGPWLLFQLINGATVGLFNGITSTEGFCQFVEEAEISMLGVVPSLVKSWQARNATQNCDWSKVRKFSSTGEASDPLVYLWLMSRVPGYAPVMEYCGGTEIGGSFLSSTMVQPNVPSMFSSPVLGSQILAIDTEGTVMEDSAYRGGADGAISGELVILPPSIGLSTKLLNRVHLDVYYKGMPTGPNGEVLRRHGDEVEFVRSSLHLAEDDREDCCPYFRALGRCDDTMNIGGIKVGSVEIERVCNLVEEVQETAAIAVSGLHGGPSKLGKSPNPREIPP